MGALYTQRASENSCHRGPIRGRIGERAGHHPRSRSGILPRIRLYGDRLPFGDDDAAAYGLRLGDAVSSAPSPREETYPPYMEGYKDIMEAGENDALGIIYANGLPTSSVRQNSATKSG